MTLKQYLFEGTSGNPVTEGTTATAANVGISTAVTIPSGGSITHRAAAKHQGTYGIRIVNPTTAAITIRMNPVASNVTMARTTAITLPALPTASANDVTLWNVRHVSGVILRLIWRSTGILEFQKVSGTNHNLGSFSAGQQIAVRVWMTVGTTTTNGIVHFEIQNKNGSTISGTSVDLTNADLGTAAVTHGDLGVTAALPQSYTIDFDSDQWDDGRASFIPQIADAAPAVDVGRALSVDSSGTWSAYDDNALGGTILANVTDSDSTTTIRSSENPAVEDKVRFAIQRLNPASSLVITPDWQTVGTGTGTWYIRLYDGTTLKATWTGNSGSGLPLNVTADSAVCSTLTLDSDGAWATLHVEFGWKI